MSTSNRSVQSEGYKESFPMSAPKSVDKADIHPFPNANNFASATQSTTSEAPVNERAQPHTAPDPQETAPKETANTGGKKGFGRRVVLPGILMVAIAGGLWFAYDWWTVGRFMVSTDDAYVQGDIASIA